MKAGEETVGASFYLVYINKAPGPDISAGCWWKRAHRQGSKGIRELLALDLLWGICPWDADPARECKVKSGVRGQLVPMSFWMEKKPESSMGWARKTCLWWEGRSDGKPSTASLLFFQVPSTLSSSGLHVVNRLTLLTVKAGVLLLEQKIGPKMRGGEEKPPPLKQKAQGKEDVHRVSIISLLEACRGLRVYTCQLLCRKQFFLVCWLSCQGFGRWNLYYHEGLKGRNTVNSIFKVILWKLLISFFQGFALYSEALGITSFYLLGFIWGFFSYFFPVPPPSS